MICFIIGVGSALLPFNAIRTGKIRAGGKGAAPFDIMQSREPGSFWALVIIFSVASAVMFYFAFAKGKHDP